MSYVEKWLPVYRPIDQDLANWKLLYKEFNSKLLASGLVSVDDAGALDIDSVTSFPALGAYAGYKLFAFNDALQATRPVIIKVEYGVGKIALARGSGNTALSTFPRVRISVIFNGRSITSQWVCPTGVDTHDGSPINTVTIVSYEFIE